MSVKWQRARNTGVFRGLLVWVRVAPPVRMLTVREPLSKQRYAEPRELLAYQTNVVSSYGSEVCAQAACFELLPEFTSDAPQEVFDDLVAEWRRQGDAACEVAP